jgi:hypothetical protein
MPTAAQDHQTPSAPSSPRASTANSTAASATCTGATTPDSNTLTLNLNPGDVADLRGELARASAAGDKEDTDDDVQQHESLRLAAELLDVFQESLYYDASTMAGLNSFSLVRVI